MNEPDQSRATGAPVVVPLPSRTRERRPDGDDGPWTQGALALSFTPRNAPDDRIRLVADDSDVPAPSRAPDPETWVPGFVRAVIDVIAGERPASSLMSWVDEHVYLDLVGRQVAVAQRRRRRPTVRPLRQKVASLHVQRVDETRVEIAARVQIGQRSRALAAGLRLDGDEWLCVGLALG